MTLSEKIVSYPSGEVSIYNPHGHGGMKISVIVPVYNAEWCLRDCLSALLENRNDAEILVVDDHSSDRSAEVAREMGVRVLVNPRGRGPAAARNVGAENATGEILFFVDSDVRVHPDTVQHVIGSLDSNPEVAAVFGSYDTSPAAPNFLSQYKNLLHHYVHQISSENASTFWAGCGAIRHEIFRKAGGFSEEDYPHPSIEDIALGLKLKAAGHSIRLEKSLQVTHLKHWTPSNLLRADIFYRAVPWSRLILKSGILPNDLNLHTSQRVSAMMVWILVFSLAILISGHATAPSVCASIAAAITVIFLNRDLYRFFWKLKGPLFLLPAILWHFFYYLYSSATFLVCSLTPKRSTEKK